MAAGDGAGTALAALCEQYREPIKRFIQQRGHSVDDAEDLTQGFFARLLEKNDLAAANPARGRFRSWLLGAAKHYLANEWDKAHTQKRGGALVDAETSGEAEPADHGTPEYFYVRSCALALVERTTRRLREEHVSRGMGEFFDRVKGCIADQSPEPDTLAVVKEFGIEAGTLKSRVWRLRKRWGELVREDVADTVESPSEVEEEIRYLLQFLS